MTTITACYIKDRGGLFHSVRDIYFLAMKILNPLSVSIIFAINLQVYATLSPTPPTQRFHEGTWGSWSSWTTTSQRERVCLSGICAGDSIETTDTCLDPTWPFQPKCDPWTPWEPCPRGSSCDFQREKCCEGCAKMTCIEGKLGIILGIFSSLLLSRFLDSLG